MTDLTDEWVELMSQPKNQKAGFFAYAASIGLLPGGVDPDDERVQTIVAQIRKNREALENGPDPKTEDKSANINGW